MYIEYMDAHFDQKCLITFNRIGFPVMVLHVFACVTLKYQQWKNMTYLQCCSGTAL